MSIFIYYYHLLLKAVPRGIIHILIPMVPHPTKATPAGHNTSESAKHNNAGLRTIVSPSRGLGP